MRRHCIGVCFPYSARFLDFAGADDCGGCRSRARDHHLSRTFVDPVLSEARGVEVMTTVDGRVTLLSFPDDFPESGPGPQA